MVLMIEHFGAFGAIVWACLPVGGEVVDQPNQPDIGLWFRTISPTKFSAATKPHPNIY